MVRLICVKIIWFGYRWRVIWTLRPLDSVHRRYRYVYMHIFLDICSFKAIAGPEVRR